MPALRSGGLPDCPGGRGGRSSRHSWICQCIGMNILELIQTFDDILPLKNFMFKSCRVDKQTNKQTHPQTDTTENNTTSLRCRCVGGKEQRSLQNGEQY